MDTYKPAEYTYFTMEELRDMFEYKGSNIAFGKYLKDKGFKKRERNRKQVYYHPFTNYSKED